MDGVSGITAVVFAADVATLLVLLAGIVWSVIRPERRIWPPPGRHSWQYVLTWTCTVAAAAFSGALIFLDWNSWVFPGGLRFLVGVPIVLLGGLLALWGVATIGWTNSSGVRDGFVPAGPYRFTRNPQYVGDAVLLLGLGIVANSALLWVAHALAALCFIISPLSEEVWLAEQYGDEYERYRRATPRFL
ncbi:MAG: hypothetical protein OXT72_02775 [Gammaproteobacteria bacterium]|nr:hypothetical protein [Gammaproteobacteria bacterium]MDE0247812.1 hypothetical protein [Gammaproteobacteria bacterium]